MALRIYNKPMDDPASSFYHVRNTRPVEVQSQMWDHAWWVACRTDRRYYGHVEFDSEKFREKVNFLQTHHWTALTRCVERETERGPDGRVISGGYSRNDMIGMINWYRKTWHLATFLNIPLEFSHALPQDGVWLTVLLTSPWCDHPAFDDVKGENREMMKDDNGDFFVDKFGMPIYSTKEYHSPAALEEFLEVWHTVANTEELPKNPNGEVILPIAAYAPRATLLLNY
ncbi:Fc.00g011750.m01.CDS01 [Cosmosporella sp. VM-42]